jgi:hypothetical protein
VALVSSRRERLVGNAFWAAGAPQPKSAPPPDEAKKKRPPQTDAQRERVRRFLEEGVPPLVTGEEAAGLPVVAGSGFARKEAAGGFLPRDAAEDAARHERDLRELGQDLVGLGKRWRR